MTAPFDASRHLTEEEFFALAFPAAGEPEGLPEHLAACEPCRRRYAEWEKAAREIAGRPESESANFERAVMEKVRRASFRGGPARGPWPWALGAAACLVAFWAGTRMRPAIPAPDAAPAMSAADRADDRLLRDVSRLVEEDDPRGWKSLAPLPGEPGGKS